VEAVNKGFEEYKAANDARLKEIEGKGAADPLLEEKMARIDADIAEANKTLEGLVLAEKRRRNVVTDEKGNVVDMEAKASQWAEIVGRETGFRDQFGADAMDDYKSAFLKLAKKSFNTDHLTDVEKKALSVGVDSAGGYFVYPDLSNQRNVACPGVCVGADDFDG